MFDCATAPTSAVSTQVIAGPRGFHGMVIDSDGNLIGADANNVLIRSTYEGDWSGFTAGLPGTVQQMDWLPSQTDFATALSPNATSVARISSTSEPTQINANLMLYSVVVGPDGMVGGAGNFDGHIHRLNTTTGESDVLMAGPSTTPMFHTPSRSATTLAG
ncbi:MAG: hypothetical protein GWP91_07555 [Rhodobacterales bacterium]|nr:hypothetical protein [Rhodobacterales bacterium]